MENVMTPPPGGDIDAFFKAVDAGWSYNEAVAYSQGIAQEQAEATARAETPSASLFPREDPTPPEAVGTVETEVLGSQEGPANQVPFVPKVTTSAIEEYEDDSAPVGGEGGPLGSWLIEEETEPMNGYPQFTTSRIGPGDFVGPVVATVVSTATEKLFDKGSGNSMGKIARGAAGVRTGRRRRRRRLLTCSDKADIAYLVGQLGQGQLGKAAISALLSRRCG